jgi:hypothetical protein
MLSARQQRSILLTTLALVLIGAGGPILFVALGWPISRLLIVG